MKRQSDPGTTAERLELLYSESPGFECEPGCTECCGCVPMTAIERARLKKHREPGNTGLLDCPYVDKKAGRCVAYNDRPLLCRLFGATEDLRCPRGCGPSALLSGERTRIIMEAYWALESPDLSESTALRLRAAFGDLEGAE
jgi:hypothetical protein